MQPVLDEMPVVTKIIAQLLYYNNLPINNYIFCVRTVVSSDLYRVEKEKCESARQATISDGCFS